MKATDIFTPTLVELVFQIDKIGGVPCSNATAFYFYEPYSGLSMAEFNAAAKALCAECPLKVECLQVALEAGEPYGIWGGLTPEERRALKRR